MNIVLISTVIIISILICMYAFLYAFHYKLKKLEASIMSLFRSRTDTIPGIYEVSKEHLSKHEDIFKESLRLRKSEFSLFEDNSSFTTILQTESHIHHEINFIFKVCNKHPKLFKNGNFIYLRDSVIQKSTALGDLVKLYKHMIKKYNSFIDIKNYSLIGMLLPISKKNEL